MIAQLVRVVSMLMLVYSCAFAWAADNIQHKTVDGIEVFYGVVPSEVMQGHVKQHEADRMHGASRLARGTHHLVITLYDVKTKQRINDAKVNATVTLLGLAPETKTLEIMKINEFISYGNYFSMPPDDMPYRILLAIDRPVGHPPVTAEFEYRHGINR